MDMHSEAQRQANSNLSHSRPTLNPDGGEAEPVIPEKGIGANGPAMMKTWIKRIFNKRTAVALGIILAVIVVAGGIALLQARSVIEAAKQTAQAARSAYDAGKNQDLVAAGQQLTSVKENLTETQERFQKLKWTAWIPIAGRYWKDGDHGLKAAQSAVEAASILVAAVEPYADVLGFQGQGSFLGGTAEDRIVKVVETLDKVAPQLDQVAEKLEIVVSELGAIDAKRYAFTIEGMRVDESIRTGQALSQDALFATTRARPAIENLPRVLGIDGERKYMVLFQNDAELRSTGGFMTAFAILRVEKGKVFQEKSQDIYDLDEKFNSKLPAPDIIRTYLPLVYRFNLRDMNISPDFKVSMDEFSKNYESIRGEPKINGIIAVDTQVLKDIVEVLGPIEVPGYGTYSAENDPRCDCPQIIYELEALADRPQATLRENRKGILAPMLQTILLKSYGAPKQVWPALFETIIQNVQEKHVLFYFFAEAEQNAAEQINVAGRIQEYDSDYFHLNDTNFAGAKSNMFTTQEVEQTYEIADDGTITKSVTIKYQNPFPPSNCNLEAGELCLNGVLRDFVRVYVPKGSKLLESLGSEDEVQTKEDLGKTVFEAFFTLRPEGQAKLIFTYQLPMKAQDSIDLLIQKQPGKQAEHYTIHTPETTQELDLSGDKEISLDL